MINESAYTVNSSDKAGPDRNCAKSSQSYDGNLSQMNPPLLSGTDAAMIVRTPMYPPANPTPAIADNISYQLEAKESRNSLTSANDECSRRLCGGADDRSDLKDNDARHERPFEVESVQSAIERL